MITPLPVDPDFNILPFEPLFGNNFNPDDRTVNRIYPFIYLKFFAAK